MISIPTFIPGGSIKSTATGWAVTSPDVNPPAPLPNGGYNFNAWSEWLGASGDFQLALNFAAVLNADFPLSVSQQGNLVMTDLATGQAFRIA